MPFLTPTAQNSSQIPYLTLISVCLLPSDKLHHLNCKCAFQWHSIKNCKCKFKLFLLKVHTMEMLRKTPDDGTQVLENCKAACSEDVTEVLGTFIWVLLGTLMRICGEEGLTDEYFGQFDIQMYTHTHREVCMANSNDTGDLVQILKVRISLNGTPPMQIPSRRNQLEWRLLSNQRCYFELPNAFIQKFVWIPLQRPVQMYTTPVQEAPNESKH